MWRLFFPLRYFSLQNKEKQRIDFWPTLILALILTTPYVAFENSNYFASGGFLDKIIPLSSALTAFYVAALVAVATFSHADLDKEITLGAIYVIEKDETGNSTRDYLTRRQFACIIFGYLAFISMILSVAAAIAVTISGIQIGDHTFDIPNTSISMEYYRIVNFAWQLLFNATISHMIVVTALGIYYIMERMHDREPKILTKKPGKTP